MAKTGFGNKHFKQLFSGGKIAFSNDSMLRNLSYLRRPLLYISISSETFKKKLTLRKKSASEPFFRCNLGGMDVQYNGKARMEIY
jgi:hypothetical protein